MIFIKESDYYPQIKEILLSDSRILNIIQNKKIMNGYRPDLIVFLKEPIILSQGTQFESKIEKCFAIEVKIAKQMNWIIKGIKQTYDKYKGQEYKGYKIEASYFLTVPFENYLYNENDFHQNIRWTLKRVCWQFGIGWVEYKKFNNKSRLCFELNEQHKFRIKF